MSSNTYRFPALPKRGSAEALIPEARSRQRKRRIRIGILLMVVLCVAAIAYGVSQSLAGGGSPNAAAAATRIPNPCQLLTNGDAARALGVSIQFRSNQVPLTEQSPNLRMCTWTGGRLASLGYENNIVILQVEQTTRSRFLRAQQEQHASVAKLTGLGEAAYANAGPYYAVNVFSHGLWLTARTGSGASIQTDRHLARLAVERLR